MLKIFSLLAIIVSCFNLSAQMKDGSIVYERKVNVHKRIPPDQESMKNMIPEFNVSKAKLVFSENETVFKNLQEEKDVRETAGEPENDRVVLRFGGTDDQTYINYAKKITVEQRELGPKKYIIQDSLRNFGWKLDEQGETKNIKGYACKKATGKGPQGAVVTAWYTDQITCPGGPEIFGGLPGMILELNISDGEIVFSPLEISSKTDKDMVKAPTNGKKLNRKEFEKIMQDQMGVSPGGGPVIRIYRNDNN